MSLYIFPRMMEAEMVSETLGFYPQLTRLVAREEFIFIVSNALNLIDSLLVQKFS
jgi:hypothetical protein